ncbi:hypothetical protein OAJ56_02010, partial [Flavobacteriales bacterium]|nr:hypothetical protein [Flavobacteriales bacterium]
MEKKINPLDQVIDYRAFLYNIMNNWFYFLLSLILAIAIAFAYTRYSQELYKSSTKIRINSENESPSTYQSLYDNLSNKDNISINDVSKIFSSYPLVFQTVSDTALRFDISYYLVGNVKTSESFSAPIKVICDTSITQNNPVTKFEIDIIDETSYKLSNDELDFKDEYNFGDTIQIQSYNFVVERDYDYKSEILPKTIVEFKKLKAVSKRYQSAIQIETDPKMSNIIEISILEVDQRKGVKFLNTLVRNYIHNDTEKRKEASGNVVRYIDNEIQLLRDSLFSIDMELQDYKNLHQIPDINLKTQKVYDKISRLESELSIYKYQDKYYSYLEDYINNGDELERVIAPSTYGINNPTLSELIKQLVNIQLQKKELIDGGQINNPSVSDFDSKIIQFSSNIKELINNSKQTNLIIIQDLNSRIALEESYLNELPIEQRELLDIQRTQNISESLYLFLQEKRYEANSRHEEIISNINQIEPAKFFNKNPVTPNVTRVYTISLLAGLLLPLLLFLILDLINDKIRSRMDLEKLTEIEMIGVIGRNHAAKSLLTDLNPKSSISEGFRALRSNLSYKNYEGKDKVYLLTSSVSGEGKTFIASNLAIVFA